MAPEPSNITKVIFVTQLSNNSFNSTLSPLNATSTDDPFDAFNRLIPIILPTIFGFICAVGLFGNSLVIIVVVFNKNMRNTTNILILSLAVADLLFLLEYVPIQAANCSLSTWPFGDVWCKVASYMTFVYAYASVYTLVIMSIDRYLAVVHAIRSMAWRSERNTWIAVAFVWISVLCGNIPTFQQWGVVSYLTDAGETRSTCYYISDSETTFFRCFFIFGYIIPLGITTVMYGLMLKRLLCGVVLGRGNQSAEITRVNKLVTRMVVIVIVVFALCWLPLHITLFWHNIGDIMRSVTHFSILVTGQCLSVINSCVNPILYAFLSDNFRRSFRKLLCCSGPSCFTGNI